MGNSWVSLKVQVLQVKKNCTFANASLVCVWQVFQVRQG